MASDKQVGLVTSLVSTRWQTLGAPDKDTALSTVLGNLTNLDVVGTSKLIDRLMSILPDPDPTMPEVVRAAPKKGTNSSPGTCSSCGHVVERCAGWYFGTNGAWKVHHKTGECSDEPIEPKRHVDVAPGVYMVGDDLFRIYHSQSGYLCGQRLENGHLTYLRGAVNIVAQSGRPATYQEVGAMGQKFSTCMCCGRPLSDDGDNRSMRVGYGRTCAGKMGWPWG